MDMLTPLKSAGTGFDATPFAEDSTRLAGSGKFSKAKHYFLENYDKIIICIVCAYILILPTRFLTSVKDILCASLISFWLIKMGLKKRILFERTPLDIPILLFGLIIVSSIFTSMSPWKTLDEIRGEFLKVFALFYFSVNNINTERQIKTVIMCIAWTSLIYALYSVVGSVVFGVEVVGKGGLIDFQEVSCTDSL